MIHVTVLEQFGRGRETSAEILRAICEAARNPTDRERLWAVPTGPETASILARAWALADPEETELYWGCERHRRPA